MNTFHMLIWTVWILFCAYMLRKCVKIDFLKLKKTNYYPICDLQSVHFITSDKMYLQLKHIMYKHIMYYFLLSGYEVISPSDIYSWRNYRKYGRCGKIGAFFDFLHFFACADLYDRILSWRRRTCLRHYKGRLLS